MSTGLVRSPAIEVTNPVSLDPLKVATMLAQSGYFGDVKEAGQALAKMLAGQELGLGPIASMMGVYYAQGKVTYSANIMAAAIKKSGRYNYRVLRLDDARCEIEFLEQGQPAGRSDFSVEDAKTAGLLDGPNKHNWTKYRRNMLFARAMSNGAKWYCPDIFGGVTPYTPEELGAEVSVDEGGSIAVVDPRPNGHLVAAEVVPALPAPDPAPNPEEDAQAVDTEIDALGELYDLLIEEIGRTQAKVPELLTYYRVSGLDLLTRDQMAHALRLLQKRPTAS